MTGLTGRKCFLKKEKSFTGDKMKFRISVVVPVYNTKAKYIEECLESVFRQTYKPFEIIVVNDGSTRKETLDYIKKIERKGSAIVIHQKNKKISGALNTGIKSMKGNWWAGCSSDDKWVYNKLEEQVKYASDHPDAKVIYADWFMMDENGNITESVNEVTFSTIIQQRVYLCHAYFSTWSNMFVHKSVFDDIGLFNESFPTSEDYEMNIRIAQKYLFHKVPKPLMMYRIHPEQLSESEWGWKGGQGSAYTSKAQDLARKLLVSE